MNKTNNCVRFIVLIYNTIFWLLGVSILGYSVFLYVESRTYVGFEDTSALFDAPFFVIMALGAIMTLVGFLGCCGAIRESSCLLGTYIFLCVAMCVACGSAVWWSNTYKEDVRVKVLTSLQRVIQGNYLENRRGPTEAIIDKVQEDFQCCGVKNFADWSSSKYNQPNRTKPDIGVGGDTLSTAFAVPASCCNKTSYNCELSRKGITEKNMESKKTDINTEGCFDKLGQFVESKWGLLIMIGVVLICCQIIALLLTCCFCCTLYSK
ncbi:CD63 antigen-like [Brevipalpus obovatus]|uniref:CD63 antigen-like n=1 Tax=Brevipalpus obovatus TaxID=246614 RepID=UPI003D9DCA64